MANRYGMNSASYDQATSTPLAISELVRQESSTKRPKLSLSASKQKKQTCLWGWTKDDNKVTSTPTTSTSTCTSPAQDTVKSDHTTTTVNESFESEIHDNATDNANAFDDKDTTADKNDDDIVEEPTQILLGQEIEGYTTTQASTQENEWNDAVDDEEDRKPAPAIVDNKKSYHNFDEDIEDDEVELLGVSPVLKTEASLIERPVTGPNVYCDYCQNFGQKCHELAFGEFLVQEVISWFEEKDKDDQKLVTAAHVRHEMKWNYNRHLNFSSWDHKRKYDDACWHDMPGCLLLHSVAQAVTMINSMQLLAKLKDDREGGAAKRYNKYPGNATSQN